MDRNEITALVVGIIGLCFWAYFVFWLKINPFHGKDRQDEENSKEKKEKSL